MDPVFFAVALVVFITIILIYINPFVLIVLIAVVAGILIMLQQVLHRTNNSYFSHPDPVHLIVLQHGWCAPWIRTTLTAKALLSMAASKHALDIERNKYLIHVIRSNSDDYIFGFLRTQDGIDRGGQRTCDEIKSVLDAHRSIQRISLIGASLGGLYIRYAVKQLYDHQTHTFYGGVQPTNFITLCSPHLGADDVVQRTQRRLYDAAGYLQRSGLLPATLSQLLRLDGDREHGLLHRMGTDEEYLQSLRAFRVRTVYSNTINDHRVSFSSGMIWPSFGCRNEEEIIKTLFRRDIEIKEQQKLSVVEHVPRELERKIKMEDGDGGMKDVCLSLGSSMEWNRFAVTNNSMFAHGVLSNPAGLIGDELAILDHLEKHIQW